MEDACSPPVASIRSLPPEIIEEILCNLPVKSLIQFRSVSKSWRSIISDPKFIRRHLSLATLSHKRLFMNHYFSRFNLERAFSCSLSSASKLPIAETTDLVCPFQGDPYTRVGLRAFCDELWCVEVNSSLYLWNPSIRSYRKISDQPVRPCPQPSNRCLTESVYGLGYDPVTDDYKLLRVRCVHEDGAESDLYSLRSDSWTKVQPFPGNVRRGNEGQLVNGALHWMVDLPDSSRALAIICFDLSSDKYGEVPQPEYSPAPVPNSKDVHVAVLRGMLCVLVNYKNRGGVLWGMKDYGVRESWTKILDIGFESVSSLNRRGPWMRMLPVYLYEKGEFLVWALVENKWDLLLLKDEDEGMVAAEALVACGRSKISNALVHVESLVSPATWPAIS